MKRSSTPEPDASCEDVSESVGLLFPVTGSLDISTELVVSMTTTEVVVLATASSCIFIRSILNHQENNTEETERRRKRKENKQLMSRVDHVYSQVSNNNNKGCT